MDIVRFDYDKSFLSDNPYELAVNNTQIIENLIDKLCKKHEFSEFSAITLKRLQGMFNKLIIILSKLRRAYIFSTYSPDSDFIKRITHSIKRAVKLKEDMRHIKPFNGRITFLNSTKTQFGNIESLYLEVQHSAERLIDSTSNQCIYSKESWPQKNVLIGTLRNSKQLSVAIKHKFYHIPKHLVENPQDIKCVAVYQSKNLFNTNSGIRYYGKVIAFTETERHNIKEIPSDSDEIYIRFEIEEWKVLKNPPIADYLGNTCVFTTLFQLINSAKASELLIADYNEFCLYGFMKEHVLTQGYAIFNFYNLEVIYNGEGFNVLNNKRLVAKITNQRFLNGGVSAVKLVADLVYAQSETLT